LVNKKPGAVRISSGKDLALATFTSNMECSEDNIFKDIDH
jgi:hypothetical protein